MLADDMGLGKTIQAIEVINRTHPSRVLIVCPASVKYNWVKELERFLKEPRTIDLAKGMKHKFNPDASILILNYDLLGSRSIRKQLLDLAVLSGGFDLAIVDEAHYLKNGSAKRTHRLLGGKRGGGLLRLCKRRILLTGTPVLNRPIELYPVAATMAAGKIAPYLTEEQFGVRWCNGRRVEGVWDFSGASNLDDLAKRLKGYILRRTKEEVMDQLPDLMHDRIYFPIDDSELEYLESQPLSTYRKELGDKKINVALSFIRDIIDSSNSKVVIFCHHRHVIEALHRELPSVVVYGGMTAEKKQSSISRFINDPNVRCFIGNLMSAGQGINGLQEVCSHVIFVEPDWSPGVMDQAIDRLRRIGQKGSVLAQYLIFEGSIDEDMYHSLNQKRGVIKRVMSIEKETPMGILEDLIRRLEALEAGLVAPVAEPAKSKKTTKAKAAPAPEPKPEPVVSDDDDWDDEPKPAPKKAKTVTKEELQERIKSFCNSEGDECVEEKKKVIRRIFAEYGASKLKDVPENCYASVLADIERQDELGDEDDEV
jgi:SWI/SNF-related matrix-associated actin-dependent regulator 1 of chromatin subfamily A